MAHVVFYEKPGCAGNSRQKRLLVASGHVLEVRDLLAVPWTAEDLRPFFGDRPVAEWFNPLAPAVRDGELEPARFDEAAALACMIADPILIRRPLMQVGTERRCGFDAEELGRWIGLVEDVASPSARGLERCAKGDGAARCSAPEP